MKNLSMCDGVYRVPTSVQQLQGLVPKLSDRQGHLQSRLTRYCSEFSLETAELGWEIAFEIQMHIALVERYGILPPTSSCSTQFNL